jgi:hypothetical protein
MALIDTTRIRLHPTPAERLALTLATWISIRVADRMERRARRAVEVHATQHVADGAAARRDTDRARAYLLGIR